MIDSNKVKQIQDALKSFWNEQSMESVGEPTSIDDLVAAMDSMTAVAALVDIEAIVGIELPCGEVIRAGGYDNERQFVEDITSRVCKYVQEHT
ncbi:MAG TPA: hypothetical protein PKV56_19720 [Burkholderiaceae bacterium]|nr:hypothetical protein [Burkholderiaceae bacterium]